MASSEYKSMKLKQSAIKLDNRKSNQSLKALKNEIDKKQTFISELIWREFFIQIMWKKQEEYHNQQQQQ